MQDERKEMRLHLIALPHTQINDEYLSCAYTQKIAKFCKMMGADHEIILYAGEDVSGTSGFSEHVICATEKERASWTGGLGHYTNVSWDASQPHWQTFASRAMRAMLSKADKQDLLLLTTSTQSNISNACPGITAVEWAVGYKGVDINHHCCFESYSWMHHVYGLCRVENGRAFDQVIPNFFDADDFLPVNNKPDPYLLFIGRLTPFKGPHVAAAIAKRLGMRLVIAGSGGKSMFDGSVMANGVRLEGDVEYVGEVNKRDRAILMNNAACTIVPTLYVEPFGGVAVEAMMSGCPVAASDWGAFTETVDKYTGRRFRTLDQGCRAVEEAMTLNRAWVQAEARLNYSLQAIRPRFNGWFQQLSTLWDGGWYT